MLFDIVIQYTPAVIPGYQGLQSNLSLGCQCPSNMTYFTVLFSPSIHMHIILLLGGVASSNQAVNMILCNMSLNNSPCLESSLNVSCGTQCCHRSINMATQWLRSALLRLVVGTTNVSCTPQLTSCVFGQTDQCTSQVVWSSRSHLNISEIIRRLK